jgi:hypothetical protein
MHTHRRRHTVPQTLPVSQHKCMGPTRRALETGVETAAGRVVGSVFEANIELNLRFMVDTGVVGCAWVRLPAGAYRLRREVDRSSTCQVCVCVRARVCGFFCLCAYIYICVCMCVCVCVCVCVCRKLPRTSLITLG